MAPLPRRCASPLLTQHTPSPLLSPPARYSALAIGLYASYVAKWRSDADFTYGYGRAEVLSGFTNAIFLVFVAISVLIEGMHRIAEPPEVHTDNLLTVSVLGLLVNLVGLAFFHDHAHSHGGHDHGGGHSHGHNHGGNSNMKGAHARPSPLPSLGLG